MADIIVAKRVIDYVGLNIKEPPERWFNLFRDLQLNLALLQGMGSDGAKLVSVDANGNLQVGTSATGSGVAIVDGTSVSGVTVLGFYNDSGSTGRLLGVQAYLNLFGSGGNNPMLRSASASNLAAQSGLGAVLAAPPGQWSAFSAPALGAQASASRAAGGAGVRHICTGFEIIVSNQAAPVAGQLLVNLRDGATGVGAILKTWAFEIPAAVFAAIVVARSGTSYVGSAATAMTLESAAAYAAVGVSVAIDGYDAS